MQTNKRTPSLKSLHIPTEFASNFTSLYSNRYLKAAIVKASNSQLARIKPSVLYAAHVMCVIALVLSTYCIVTASQFITFIQGKEKYFYHYSSVPVVVSGVSIFCLLLRVKSVPKKLESIITVLSKYSLYAYLVSMHPAIKNCYIKWRVLGSINTSNGMLYTCEVLVTSVFVYCFGILSGFILDKLAVSIHSFFQKKGRLKRFEEAIDLMMNQ